MNLFELVAEANGITKAIIEAGGELSPELETALINIDLAMAEKVDGYDHVMERLEHEAEYWKAKADAYAKIAKAHANAKERMKNAIKSAMQAMEKTEVKGVDVRFKMTPVKPKLVIDQATLDPSYLMQVTTSVPDKERIEMALRLGDEVMGAKLEQSFALRSYANKKE